jgi:hypothetical protein
MRSMPATNLPFVVFLRLLLLLMLVQLPFVIVVVDATLLWKDVCTQPDTRHFKFCDPNAQLEERVKDYIQRIPTENQILMMGNSAVAYEPLHIPPYQWWSEGLHGPLQDCISIESECYCPTSFPAPTGLGCAFNATLWKNIGEAIGVEGRAFSNLRFNHSNEVGDGLTYWSPTINLQRDPRWGRNQEGKLHFRMKDIYCYRSLEI